MHIKVDIFSKFYTHLGYNGQINLKMSHVTICSMVLLLMASMKLVSYVTQNTLTVLYPGQKPFC